MESMKSEKSSLWGSVVDIAGVSSVDVVKLSSGVAEVSVLSGTAAVFVPAPTVMSVSLCGSSCSVVVSSPLDDSSLNQT